MVMIPYNITFQYFTGPWVRYGPTAFLVIEATYLTVEYLISFSLKSGSSSFDGGSLATIAFLNPAFL